MVSQSGEITITLTGDEALVLNALLDPVDATGPLQIKDVADLQAIWGLSAALDKVLVDTLDPAYDVLLESARARLTTVHGDPT